MRTFTLPACIALGILCASTTARADASERIVVTYSANPAASCPPADKFRESIARRAHGPVIMAEGSAGGSDVRARVDLEARSGHEPRAHVTVTAANGDIAERDIAGRSCEELAQASALLVALFAEHEASAEPPPEEPAPTPPVPSEPAVTGSAPTRDKPLASVAETVSKHFALGVNLLAIFANRYSVQIEYLPTKHHAFTANPFFVWGSRSYTQDGQAYDLGTQYGLGGELGYRYYTGTKGPNGLFFGPSLIFASYWARAGEPNAPEGLFTRKARSYSAIGGALDIGAQFVLGPGVVMGFGAGVQYFAPTDDNDGLDAITEGRLGGFSPRLLASVGYAF